MRATHGKKPGRALWVFLGFSWSLNLHSGGNVASGAGAEIDVYFSWTNLWLDLIMATHFHSVHKRHLEGLQRRKRLHCTYALAFVNII